MGSLTACLFARRGYAVNIYEYRPDIRKTSASRGRTINLSISERGRRALAAVGLDEVVLRTALPLRGRMLHLPDGTLKSVLYDPRRNQVRQTFIVVVFEIMYRIFVKYTQSETNG